MYQEASPQSTFEALQNDPQAQLIDCRTQAEWSFVGMPDLSSIGRAVIQLEWQGLDGKRNSQFVAQVEENLPKDTPIYILCRSGVRSAAACTVLAERGFTQLFNITGGFEGNTNADGHRGQSEGWKYEQLPWRQP